MLKYSNPQVLTSTSSGLLPVLYVLEGARNKGRLQGERCKLNQDIVRVITVWLVQTRWTWPVPGRMAVL